MSIAIAIEIGSPKSELNLVKTTLVSIIKNIGTDNFKIILAISPGVKKEIRDYINSITIKHPDVVELLPEKNYFWADFINTAISQSEDYKYFIKSHDDIQLLTPDFLHQVEQRLNKIIKPVGWVSFTDKDYLNGHWAPSTREGYHIDAIFENGWNKRKLFQFHNLPDGWLTPKISSNYFKVLNDKIQKYLGARSSNLPIRLKNYYAHLPYDFPNGPVKCHAPFNHFVLIERKTLKIIGECENWETYNALLVDEDWGLRALEKKFHNIWIPDIEYVHQRIEAGTRSWYQIAKDQERVHKLFYKKWGFHSNPSTDELEFIKQNYHNSYIPWSSERRSYEWDYID